MKMSGLHASSDLGSKASSVRHLTYEYAFKGYIQHLDQKYKALKLPVMTIVLVLLKFNHCIAHFGTNPAIIPSLSKVTQMG